MSGPAPIARHIIVTGVAGAGKTTLAMALEHALGLDRLDADDFHSPANRAKMAAGVPLTDEDRAPWLAAMNAALRAAPRATVLACSALKAAYRNALCVGISPTPHVVWLDGARDQIAARLATRTGHFFNPDLNDSQFATLEPNTTAQRIDVSVPVETAVAMVRSALMLA